MADVKNVAVVEIELVSRHRINISYEDCVESGHGDYVEAIKSILQQVKRNPELIEKFIRIQNNSFGGNFDSIEVVDVSEVEDEPIYDTNLNQITDIY